MELHGGRPCRQGEVEPVDRAGGEALDEAPERGLGLAKPHWRLKHIDTGSLAVLVEKLLRFIGLIRCSILSPENITEGQPFTHLRQHKPSIIQCLFYSWLPGGCWVFKVITRANPICHCGQPCQ